MCATGIVLLPTLFYWYYYERHRLRRQSRVWRCHRSHTIWQLMQLHVCVVTSIQYERGSRLGVLEVFLKNRAVQPHGTTCVCIFVSYRFIFCFFFLEWIHPSIVVVCSGSGSGRTYLFILIYIIGLYGFIEALNFETTFYLLYYFFLLSWVNRLE